MASEASQENFEKNMFLTTKYEQIVKLEHLLCPKVGGGAQTHLCPPPPTFESGGLVPPPPAPPPPPFSYALVLNKNLKYQSFKNRFEFLLRTNKGSCILFIGLWFFRGLDFWLPPWGPGGLSRECVLLIPMCVVKGD